VATEAGSYPTSGLVGWGRYGAGEGNRTLVVSLGSFCSTIELHSLVGVEYRDESASLASGDLRVGALRVSNEGTRIRVGAQVAKPCWRGVARVAVTSAWFPRRDFRNCNQRGDTNLLYREEIPSLILPDTYRMDFCRLFHRKAGVAPAVLNICRWSKCSHHDRTISYS
jgi:hypothetical protein